MEEYKIGEKIILKVEEVTENFSERCVDCFLIQTLHFTKMVVWKFLVRHIVVQMVKM